MGKYQWLDGFLTGLPGATSDYKEEWGWQRYQVGGKMFAALCRPGDNHPVYGGHSLLTLKCEPLESEEFRRIYPDILPGFYMDKRCWISVCLDGELPDELLRELCGRSYSLVFAKLTKKLQREISNP